MSSELIQSLVPFGIAGLAILALFLIAVSPTRTNIYLASGAMLLITGIVVLDKAFKPGQLVPVKEDTGGAVGTAQPINASQINWIDSGLSADWGGRDYAYTLTSKPKYKVKETELCDSGKIGYLATCWESRPSGYPPGVLLTDVPPGASPAQWCTYKNNEVTLSVAPDGRAARGRVYICAQSVPR
jgi:hypothetical protein